MERRERSTGRRAVLQVALDITELDRALQIAAEAVAGGADWLEAGTPLIKSEGMAAVRALRAAFPGHEIVADMKIADTGTIEVEMAAKAGASIVCILAVADDAVIAEAVRAANLYGVRLMGDLISVSDPVARARELERMGVHIVNAHVGIDQQMSGKSPLDVLSEIRDGISVYLAAAGGLDAATAPQAVSAGADIVIVGSAVTKSADVTASARTIRAALDSPTVTRGERPSPESAIRDILSSVSTPNISDAMHRKGAMAGIVPICGDVRMVGRAVTVQGFAGDWAKPVEAVDLAEPGDVLVISNDGVTHVACWGELATMSAMQRGLSGVVIDGAARDIDDIKRLGFPVFSRAVAPNAGEPKGFGEINAEIRCGGQPVQPGDWIAGDASGVVVVPRERAAEIARRALEVKKTEERIREEIRRGGTLSRVSDLVRWEKK